MRPHKITSGDIVGLRSSRGTGSTSHSGKGETKSLHVATGVVSRSTEHVISVVLEENVDTDAIDQASLGCGFTLPCPLTQAFIVSWHYSFQASLLIH